MSCYKRQVGSRTLEAPVEIVQSQENTIFGMHDMSN
jgi:hypothetical protein